MGFDSKRNIEIEMESAKKLLKSYENAWNTERTAEKKRIMDEQQEYVGQIAYEIQKQNLHDELVENGYIFDVGQEEMVIEYASMWSMDVLEIAEEMQAGNLKKKSFDDYVEEYVVESYLGRAGKEGLEIFREFQRWMPTNEFKDFIRNHFTDGEEYMVENFNDDYVILLEK